MATPQNIVYGIQSYEGFTSQHDRFVDGPTSLSQLAKADGDALEALGVVDGTDRQLYLFAAIRGIRKNPTYNQLSGTDAAALADSVATPMSISYGGGLVPVYAPGVAGIMSNPAFNSITGRDLLSLINQYVTIYLQLFV